MNKPVIPLHHRQVAYFHQKVMELNKAHAPDPELNWKDQVVALDEVFGVTPVMKGVNLRPGYPYELTQRFRAKEVELILMDPAKSKQLVANYVEGNRRDPDFGRTYGEMIAFESRFAMLKELVRQDMIKESQEGQETHEWPRQKKTLGLPTLKDMIGWVSSRSKK